MKRIITLRTKPIRLAIKTQLWMGLVQLFLKAS